MSLEMYRSKILKRFGHQDVIKYSLGDFITSDDWSEFVLNVKEWWRLYKDWETKDTVAAAFAEQRLTVKGTALTWKMDIEARRYKKGTDTWGIRTEKFEQPKKQGRGIASRFQQFEAASNYPLEKGLLGIQKRLDPSAFVPGPDQASLKTERGLHDQSAGLMHKNSPISKQQYKTPDTKTYFVFMPLSHAGDQAVFQNLNRLAKAMRQKDKAFYDLIRDYRSKMTRVKLAAEHDMATSFAMVGATANDRPKFRFTIGKDTDVSIRDKDVPGLQDLDIPHGKKTVQHATKKTGLYDARRQAALNFQSLVLGKIHSYGEVVVAYRQHAGNFPKFVKWNPDKSHWDVGELTPQKTWKLKAPPEAIPDKPA